MSINIPKVRPELLKSMEADFGSTIARQIYKNIMDNIYFTLENFPLGTIKLFYQAQTLTDGVTLIDPPNPDIWIKCDGEIIADPNSILNGLATPILDDKFLKHTTQDLEGGQYTIDLRHNHGGWTGYESDGGANSADGGGGAWRPSYHRHSIPTSGKSAEPVIPPYVTFIPYMRYK